MEIKDLLTYLFSVHVKIYIIWYICYIACLDGAEVSVSDWRLGGPRFKSKPRLTSQSWSSYQLSQLGSKAASDSTLKQSTTCGVSNTWPLLFTLYEHDYWMWIKPTCTNSSTTSATTQIMTIHSAGEMSSIEKKGLRSVKTKYERTPRKQRYEHWKIARYKNEQRYKTEQRYKNEQRYKDEQRFKNEQR